MDRIETSAVVADPGCCDATQLTDRLRRLPAFREAIEDAMPIVMGFDVAFVIHDLADLGSDDCAEDCPGCAMLADLAIEIRDVIGGCLECMCPVADCGRGCGCTCCCSYLPAVTGAAVAAEDGGPGPTVPPCFFCDHVPGTCSCPCCSDLYEGDR